MLSEGRELDASFADDLPARAVIRALVGQFNLPTSEDGQSLVYTLEHPAEDELVLSERETLREAGVTNASRLTLFKVIQPHLLHITIVNEQQELPASLPRDRPSRELLDHLVQYLPDSERGQKVQYFLEHPPPDRVLIADHETLEDAGIADGARIRLLKLVYPPEQLIGGSSPFDGPLVDEVPPPDAAADDSEEPEGSSGVPSPAGLPSVLGGLRSVFEEWRPYLIVITSAATLVAFFLMPVTDDFLFGLSAPTAFDLVLEIDEVADASGRDISYLAYQWAMVPFLAACMLLIGLTSMFDRTGRNARMRTSAVLGGFGAALLVVGWIGVGIADHAVPEAILRATPAGFWASSPYPSTPGFAVAFIALALSLPAGIWTGKAEP